MSIQSDVPSVVEDLGEPRVRGLDAPLSGVAVEPEMPEWARTGQPPKWPASWRVTPAKLRNFFGSEVYDSIPEPTVAVDDLFVGPTNHSPSQLWNQFIARLQRAASNSLVPHNMVTSASLAGEGPPVEVKCFVCQAVGQVLMSGRCFGGCS